MKRVVIYTRYSSDMQRTESCDDQERNVRRALPRFDVSPEAALVIRDEAESGTKSNRDGFQQLQAMIKHEQVAVLAVDDQSRLTRADNASAFIQDLVFAGGRFISTSEGIDTRQKGWELGVKAMEMKNSATIRNLSHLVRRGQEGRVLNDGSAGDFPFGYESYYRDPNWAEQLERRGPKPKKDLRICDDEARWVRQIYVWFIDGCGPAWIARELTRLSVPKGRRASTPGWHHQQVRRMLENKKYIGLWPWGETTTVRNSEGRKKQIPTPPEEHVLRERPELRIIDQATWDKAQRRLQELLDQFGSKEGQKPRGPKPNPGAGCPRSLLGGLLVCGKCGAKLWLHRSGKRRYYACPAHDKGLCHMAVQVPADRAGEALTNFLTDQLRGWPDWLDAVYRRTRELVQQAAARGPEQYQQHAKERAEVRKQIDRLVDALADGSLSSSAVRSRLLDLEGEERRLQQHLDGYDSLRRGEAALPDSVWMGQQLQRWAAVLSEEMPRAATVLRQALGSVTAHAIVAPGKCRGYAQLRFHIQAWATLRAVMGDRMPECWQAAVASPEGEAQTSPEFVLDLGEPTAMDRWAPQIAIWRKEGVTWPEIKRRTGLDLNRAYIAWKRYADARHGGTDAGHS